MGLAFGLQNILEIRYMANGKAPLSDAQISMLLSTASTYAGNAASIFALFITVLFGSLAFATALAKSDGSKATASGLIAVALLAFYIINFIAFQSANRNLAI